MSESNEKPENEPTQQPPNNLVLREPAKCDAPNDGERPVDCEPDFPSQKVILLRLEKTAGAVAMGVLPPSRANAMTNAYSKMLPYLSKPGEISSEFSDESVLKILRDQPELLAVIKGFLTKDQLDLIAREAGNE